MRIKRTTALALAASAALVIGSGVVASSAILGLPLFGFGGHEATGSAATVASTPSPSVVDQTVYDDHYVTSPAQSGSSGAPHAPSKPTAAFASLGGSTAAPPAAYDARRRRPPPHPHPRRPPPSRPRRRPSRLPAHHHLRPGAGNPNGTPSTTSGSAAGGTDGQAARRAAPSEAGSGDRARRLRDARDHDGDGGPVQRPDGRLGRGSGRDPCQHGARATPHDDRHPSHRAHHRPAPGRGRAVSGVSGPSAPLSGGSGSGHAARERRWRPRR